MSPLTGFARKGDDTSVVHIVYDADMVIAAPRAVVWPCAVAYPTWQNFAVARTVSGRPGAEGEVVALQKDEAVYRSTPYFARTLRIDPERRLIWKTYRENSDYFGIIEFMLEDHPDGTLFRKHLIYEHYVESVDPAAVAAWRSERIALVEAMQANVTPKLKQLAEARARAGG